MKIGLYLPPILILEYSQWQLKIANLQEGRGFESFASENSRTSESFTNFGAHNTGFRAVFRHSTLRGFQSH